MKVNGEEKQFEDGITITELLEKMNFNMERVVVEVDKEIVPKSDYNNKKLHDCSEIEVISFVGGG